METWLYGKRDMQWLKEVHNIDTKNFTCAIVHGNLDAPEKIELYVINRFDRQPDLVINLEENV
jgi:hypothetical protein